VLVGFLARQSYNRRMRAAGVGRSWLAAGFTSLSLASAVSAFLPTLTERQMGEALAIARGDAPAQLRFQEPYVHPLNIQPAEAYYRIDRLEVITLFRRLELIGVGHANLNDSFGRGGFSDVREALKPWLGKVSIAVNVQILPTMRFNPQLPAIDARIRGRRLLQPITVRRNPIISDAGILIAGVIESDFDSAALDGNGYQAIVLLDGKQVEAIHIDLKALR
jgi:hypothetical protein